ncbi:DUF2442 domain-containing protein [Halochromatium glycolicum]|uniref:Integron cassette protein n=1 Tax=Halochromatium glycolicum TaxID=85075 RepID=A0AAJ0U7C9_9GAMM|nr:DUF2442 domain-containing protein [Halochromatium glycolicum]MBK1706562.1 integron cassette protein [Halochromatium glycolicum]
MRSLAHGNSISEVEVTNISTHGVWLFAHGEELFMSYDDFPWFREMAVKSIVNVEEQSPDHFYWPDLDVDLTREIIKHPERFPLKSRST